MTSEITTPLWADNEGLIVEATQSEGLAGMTCVRDPHDPEKGEWMTSVEKIHLLHRTTGNPTRNGRVRCHELCKQVRPGSLVQRCPECNRLWMVRW